MPISIALLLGIPLGFLFYFEGRWLLRFFLGRYEQKERRAARFFGAFGALSIPLICCSGLIADAIPGPLGKAVSGGFFGIATIGLVGPLLKTLMEEKWRSFGGNH
ncbi:MAG: hypothetical protein ABSE53_04980 [Terracidiphilus sp.]|jgi:hypothetical protein